MKNSNIVKEHFEETLQILDYGAKNIAKKITRNFENFGLKKTSKNETKKSSDNRKTNSTNSTNNASSTDNTAMFSRASVQIKDVCSDYNLADKITIKNRDKEIDEIFGFIGKRKSNNVIVVGDPGTGRESVVYGLAEKIVHKTCYDTFKNYKVYEVDCLQFSVDDNEVETVGARITALYYFLSDRPNSIVYFKNIEKLCEYGEMDVFKMFFDNFICIGILDIGLISQCAEITEITDKNVELLAKFDFIPYGFNYVSALNPKPDELYDCVSGRLDLLQKYHGVKMNEHNFNDIVKLVHMITNGYNTGDIIDVADQALAIAHNKGFKSLNIKCIMETYRANIDAMFTSDEELIKLFAYHEAGHSIIALNHQDTTTIETVTIIPSEGTGGYNYFSYKNDMIFSKKEYMNIIEVLLGGYVGTDLKGYGQNIGASQDIKVASDIARSMFLFYGFDEKSAPISYATNSGQVSIGYMSDKMKDQLASNVDHVLKVAMNSAKRLMSEDEDKLEIIAQALIKKAFLTKDEVLDLYNGKITVDDLPSIKDLIF